MSEKITFKERVEEEDWEILAQTALALDIEISQGSEETKKLKKELEVIKQSLHQVMKHPEYKSKVLNASFFVGMVKTIEKIEQRFDRHQVERREFLLFLKTVLYKIEKEKLVVEKHTDRCKEFKKMKKKVEQEDDSV